MKRAIYKYSESFGRMGHLESVFVEFVEFMDALVAENAHVSLGDALGKHSDITATISADTITQLSDLPEVVEIFDEHVGTVGHDLIERWAESTQYDIDGGDPDWAEEHPAFAAYARLHEIEIGE